MKKYEYKELTITGKNVNIFLTNGVKLKGRLMGGGELFGSTCVFLDFDGITQPVFMRAVATILPMVGDVEYMGEAR